MQEIRAERDIGPQEASGDEVMLSVVVLAAGKGTRMRSETPKVLHNLMGVPLLDYALESARAVLSAHGQGETATSPVVVIGHGRAAIEAAFPGDGVTWAYQAEQLGTGHAAHVGIAALSSPPSGRAPSSSPESEAGTGAVLVLNGDLPLLRHETLQRLVAHHTAHGADVTSLTCVKTDPTGFGRIVRNRATGTLQDIVEESDTDETTRSIREVNVGTYVFRLDAFRTFYDRIDRENRQGELYLTDVVVEATRAGARVETVAVEDESETAQVNSRAELARAAEILRDRLLEAYMRDGVTIDDPRSTYIEKGVRIGRDAHIRPFTVIERGVEIAACCEVGPFAHLRPGTRLESGASIGNFVETKASTIGEGTKIRHLTYVGDATVGNNVNIGAGTIVANYDGRRKHSTTIGEGAFVGSGTILVAPVRVGKGAVTGAGAVVLRNRDVGDGDVVAGVPARTIKTKKQASPGD